MTRYVRGSPDSYKTIILRPAPAGRLHDLCPGIYSDEPRRAHYPRGFHTAMCLGDLPRILAYWRQRGRVMSGQPRQPDGPQSGNSRDAARGRLGPSYQGLKDLTHSSASTCWPGCQNQ